MQNKIVVVGIGPGDENFITPAALKKIRAAKFLIGGRRALDEFAAENQITCAVTRDLDTPLNFIRDKIPLAEVVVMVSGDPGYFSLLDLLRKNFPPASIEVIPSISAIQLAFARLSLPWHDATLLSFHGRQPARETLKFSPGKILGLLTDANFNSATVSRLLLDCGWDKNSRVNICERLSYPDEKIFTTNLADAAQAAPVNHCVLIVQAPTQFTAAKNPVDDNVDKLLELFPQCATEILGDNGQLYSAVNFDALKQLLDTRLVDGRESYVFDFVGKRRATLEAHKPIRKTLRPILDKSRDFDSTQNLYVEGDNLDALKLLQESYLHKVKLIYIDPPYNTGNDFIYRDDFSRDVDDFDDAAQALDADGNRILNRESRGRFHSDWCAMIYSRLLLAKHFLAPDGVIFISIDDHEQANLKKICDEIFGEKNFVANLVWKKKYTGGKGTKTFADYHEYILCYAKNIYELGEVKMPRPENEKAKFTQEDEYVEERGRYYTRPLKSNLDPRPTLVYPITLPNGNSVTTQWICAKNTYEQLLSEGRIEFKSSSTSKYPVYKKFYENDDGGNVKIPSFLEISSNNEAKEELKRLFNINQTRDLPFQTPKPLKLIELFIKNFTANNDIILDFFSGSATTAHAVMELNAQDGGHRRFIMIQLPESTPDNSEARRAGYSTICDIGEERIRRAGDKLKIDNPALDVGFRVFKVDSANFIDMPDEWTPEILLDYVENIKPDRDALDLLFGELLETGATIHDATTLETIDGVNVLNYGGEILACFEKNLPEKFFHKLAARKPEKVLFRDASFASSADKINALEYFRYFAPDTEVKVL